MAIDENANLTYKLNQNTKYGFTAGQTKTVDIGGAQPVHQFYGLMRVANNWDHYDTDHDKCLYEGQYISAKECGYARQICMRGTCYDGQFQANDFEGEGKMVHPNGTIEEGIWKQGKLIYPQDFGNKYNMCDYQ